MTIKTMLEHLETAHVATTSPMATLFAKKYVLLAIVILIGAISHAIEDARRSGWKGFAWFGANVFVAGFVGIIFSNVASLVSPDWMFIAGGVGGYMGPVAFKYVQEATLVRLGMKHDKK